MGKITITASKLHGTRLMGKNNNNNNKILFKKKKKNEL